MTDPNAGILEVLFDIGRTLGERRLCRDGDTREDFQDALRWAEQFEEEFVANPDAGETYYEDIETFTIACAQDAGFTPLVPEVQT